MGIGLFYLIALIMSVIGLVFYFIFQNIHITEWAIANVICFVLAGMFHLIGVSAATHDVETWSGMVEQVYHTPRWVEEYQEAVYKTNSDGDRVFSHYVTKHRTHRAKWYADTNYGSDLDRLSISESDYKNFGRVFGGSEQSKKGYRPGYDSGDRNDYYVLNKTRFVIPTVKEVPFENRVKASQSLYSFSEVPEGMAVFPYPAVISYFQSSRLVGTASNDFNITEYDKFCTAIGASEKVNVVMVGYPASVDSIQAHYQEAAWIGGKKNDLVICYAKGDDGKAIWAYTFGWSDREIVKKNLDTIFLDNVIDSSILPLVSAEIKTNYVIKEWDDFNYLDVEPPTWCYWVYFIVLIIAQGVFYFFAFNNDFDGMGLKSSKKRNSYY